MSTEPAAETEEVPAWDGPDPREWEGHPGIWDRVKDIEAVDRVLAVLNGPIAQEGGAAYHEARRLLTHMGYQLRGVLSVEILSAYGIAAGDTEVSGPFERAGKPRAFGVDSQPPPPGTV